MALNRSEAYKQGVRAIWRMFWHPLKWKLEASLVSTT